jgi:hypothetical protein
MEYGSEQAMKRTWKFLSTYILNWSTILSMIKIYNRDFRVWVWSLSTEYKFEYEVRNPKVL